MNEKLLEFHRSTTIELIAIMHRVRNLINNQHWGEDGKYKEAILMNVIKRFLPGNINMGSGFVVSARNDEHYVSKQIDIIIYDDSFPVIFKEGGFVIVPVEGVRGLIEVKANAEAQDFDEVYKKASIQGMEIWKRKQDKTIPLFNGIFSFEGTDTLKRIGNRADEIRTVLDELTMAHSRRYDYVVNHIAFNSNIFMKLWPKGGDRNEYSAYNIEYLSFSYFISNLVYFVSDRANMVESELWFPQDKERSLIGRY